MTSDTNTTGDTSTALAAAWETYLEENEKFEIKGVKAAAARARKALGDIRKLSGVRRKEIIDAKNAMATKA